MKKRLGILFICILLICSTTSLALTPFSINKQQKKQVYLDKKLQSFQQSNYWITSFGGTGADEGLSVQQTTDGGYIIVGCTESFGAGDYDIWLIKTDANGDEIWNKTFGGLKYEIGLSVQQTTDGGYILTGWTGSFGTGEFDVWLIKTDSNGNKEWDKTFGGSGSEVGQSVQQTSDGGYIIVGYIVLLDVTIPIYDAWLIKTDSKGNKLWDKTYGGTYAEWGYCVKQTSDGGYIITGATTSYGTLGDEDIWLIKTDKDGNEMWNNTFGSNHFDFGYSVQQTNDGGYILTGEINDFGAGGDAWLIKTDNNGDMLWNKTFGGDEREEGLSVQQTTDGGYIVAGQTWSFGAGNFDAWLIKTDSDGNKEWDRTYGGLHYDSACSVQQTNDGGYILTGTTESFGALIYYDVWLIKTNSQGLVSDPPEKPTITGKSTGKPGAEYEYKFMSTDPEGDNIYYCIDWGDNSSLVCIGPYLSGEEASAKYTWSEEGTYIIKVKARDVYGAESDWTTFFVDMPKTYINNPIIQLILKLLGRFPLFEKILNQILP